MIRLGVLCASTVKVKNLSLHEYRIELTGCLHPENVHSISFGSTRRDRAGSSNGMVIHGRVI